MREVVTVQLGGFANYVGSHFWNFQDEALGADEDGLVGLDMNVLYRVGETRQGIGTYTPRLLAFDLRGSLGAVRAAGSLYERSPQFESSAVATWNGQTVTHRHEPIPKNDFLKSLDEESEGWSQPSVSGSGFQLTNVADTTHSGNSVPSEETRESSFVQSLDDSVEYWTDYLKAHLHPRSVYELPNTFHGLTPFDNYSSGQGFFKEQEQLEEVENRLRFFVEECDHLQGFQFMVDNSGGFAAVAADFLEAVGDEYNRTPKLLFSLRPPWIPPKVSHRDAIVASLHESVSLARLSSLSNLLVPAGLQQLASSKFARHLCVNDSKLFCTSAVYATALNTITLPFRMEVSGPTATSQERGFGSSDMSNMVRLVSCSQQKKVALLEAAVPGPALPVAGTPGSFDLASLSSLTPDVDHSYTGTQAAEALVIQGARLPGGGGSASVAQVLECTFTGKPAVRRGALSLCQLSVSPNPLPIPVPFPSIFGPYVSARGDILPNPIASTAGRGGLDVLSIPIAARVTSTDSLLPYVKGRLTSFRKLGLSRASVGGGVLEDWGFAKEEAQDLAEGLGNLASAYSDRRFDSATDSD
ncbi:hypothetical protein M758_6G207800 [Ceratodon purpureus]|uniref:Uncharacterized protein n=1 Tax=Ceratodon purpureus TaxID=3225 RepID=A0A8T0HK49_CERPU|nr:hypothetical protein KC19_6G216900 [Ceratodon purpureus]KAG0614840.1 hypothetical protein M758_6G207800 [Ceratodon purpureus]